MKNSSRFRWLIIMQLQISTFKGIKYCFLVFFQFLGRNFAEFWPRVQQQQFGYCKILFSHPALALIIQNGPCHEHDFYPGPQWGTVKPINHAIPGVGLLPSCMLLSAEELLQWWWNTLFWHKMPALNLDTFGSSSASVSMDFQLPLSFHLNFWSLFSQFKKRRMLHLCLPNCFPTLKSPCSSCR